MVYSVEISHMIKDILKEIEDSIVVWLEQKQVSEPAVQLERSISAEFGEYSTNVAMRYAKPLQQNPFALAEELAAFLLAQTLPNIAEVQAVAPGFVNIYLSDETRIQHIKDIVETGDQFGVNTVLQGQKWVVEHTSPNPNKAMHIGHLRLNLIGMSIVRLLKASGAEVVADAVYNDRGIAIAKLMYGYLAHMKKKPESPTDLPFWFDHQTDWYTPAEKGVRPDVFVSTCYVQGEQDFKRDQTVEQLVRDMVVAWEANDHRTWELWKLVLTFSYAGIEATLDRLGSHWDKVWYEHDHYQKGREYVEQGLAQGLFQKLEDGAVITNLEETYGLSDTVLLKNDGTSLYITQDIALTDLKKKTYQADRLVWVIGPEQSLAMRQLFAVCEQLGIGSLDDFTHVSYGYVGLKDETGAFKKMSSREGTVLLIDDVIDSVKTLLLQRYEESSHPLDETKKTLAEKLAVAAVKFAFLKYDRTQDLSFDIEQSVDLQGDSGMYVLYTYVRTQSILRKATTTLIDCPVPAKIGTEAELIRTLLYYEDVVLKATDDLSVHHVAQYVLELTSAFNSWYANETVLDGSENEPYKLVLVKAVGITIQNSLTLLGIETVEEM